MFIYVNVYILVHRKSETERVDGTDTYPVLKTIGVESKKN